MPPLSGLESDDSIPPLRLKFSSHAHSEARADFVRLYAGLKRRSSTVLHAFVRLYAAWNAGPFPAANYSSDFGSDLFSGDFVSSSDTNCWAHDGTPTFRSTMISFALNFFP